MFQELIAFRIWLGEQNNDGTLCDSIQSFNLACKKFPIHGAKGIDEVDISSF